MLWLFVVLAIVSGAVLPVQVTLNARLGAGLGSPVFAALTNFLVGSVALIVFVLVSRLSLPVAVRLTQVPPLAWLGGLLGAFYVLMTVVLAPRLGTALLFGLVIVGQLLVSLVIDHFGLFGLPVHRASVLRALGVLLVAAGVYVFRRF